MVDNVVPTVAPKQTAQNVLESLPAQSHVSPLSSERETLFDSIAQKGIGDEEEPQDSSIKTFFTAMLWTRYAIAIVVALVLVWSAAKELLH
jgi:hypothetical protein